MIFGETWEEEKARLSEWHLRFAWYPVWLDDGRWVWLSRYWFRSEWFSCGPFLSGWLKYRKAGP